MSTFYEGRANVLCSSTFAKYLKLFIILFSSFLFLKYYQRGGNISRKTIQSGGTPPWDFLSTGESRVSTSSSSSDDSERRDIDAPAATVGAHAREVSMVFLLFHFLTSAARLFIFCRIHFDDESPTHERRAISHTRGRMNRCQNPDEH